jgi:preprotein translocase subunit YajC
MRLNFPFIPISAIVAIIVFAYMRNKQARRNDERRERLEQKQEELIELLKKNNLPTEKNTDDES